MTRLGVPGGGGPRGRCLGDRLTAYADRAMEPAALLHWDRHLVACTACRAAVEDERRVLAALRSPASSAVPGDLRSLLLAVAAEHGVCGSSRPGASSLPAVPAVPLAPVPVVDRGAPALHRSARRATVFAGIAAGATAAAAWGIAVSGAPVTPTPQPVSPAVQRTRPAQGGFATAAFTVRGLGASSAVWTTTRTNGPASSAHRARWAESTP